MNPTAPTLQSTARVLLVEDEPKLRKSLAEGMELETWTVVDAGTGAEALQHLVRESFDLIVLDWMLPDCDGLDLIHQLRAQGIVVPVLVITARGGASAHSIATNAGATDFLPKPFSFDDLIDRARMLLTLHTRRAS